MSADASVAGTPIDLHEYLRHLEVPLCVVRDDDSITFIAYTRQWAELLGWDPDEFVGVPSLDIGFLPDYIGGSTPNNVAEMRMRLEKLCETSAFTRPLQRKDGEDIPFEGMVFAWTDPGDVRHFVFVEQQQLQIGPEEVVQRATEIVDILPYPAAEPTDDDTATRARLTVRIDNAIADDIGQLARDEGVTLNALVQAALEGVVGAHRISDGDIRAGSVGFILAAARAMAGREVKRARHIDYERRNTRSR